MEEVMFERNVDALKQRAFDAIDQKCKKLEQENSELKRKTNIFSFEDISLGHVVYYFDFCRWLSENGWRNYVDSEKWINTSEGNKVRHIKELFIQFRVEYLKGKDY